MPQQTPLIAFLAAPHASRQPWASLTQHKGQRGDPLSPSFQTLATTRAHPLIVGATALIAGAAQAAAEATVTMHIEEQTSWVRNLNPFDLGGRRQPTMDFVYEPLVIFNDYDGGKPCHAWMARRPLF